MLIKLNRIKKKNPCTSGWKCHLESLPIDKRDIKLHYTSLEAVLVSNDFDDFEWVMDDCTSKAAKKDFILRFANMMLITYVDNIKQRKKLQEALFKKDKACLKAGGVPRTRLQKWKYFVSDCLTETHNLYLDIEGVRDAVPDFVGKDYHNIDSVMIHVLKHMPTERYYRKGVKK